MDLHKYFADLGDALCAGGMTSAQSAAYCKRLSDSLGNLEPAAREQKLASYGSPEDLAKRVLSIASKQAEASPAEDEQKANPALEHTINVDAGKRAAVPMTRAIPVVHTNEEEKTTVMPNPELQATKKKLDPVKQEMPEEEAPKKPISKRGMQIFWWSVGLSSPIWLFLAFVLAGLFLFAYGALIVAAVGLIVALTVTVIGGILLAIIGLGYGIVEMLPGTDAFFVGLYEFGLGMIVVGGTIIFSILEYNGATVLVPYTLKKLTVFLKFTIRQIKQLIIHLYDRCRDL
ncbi:MAG: hypothetical protein E7599_00095 [Ruminococcaceae bacterium]|nr:hypothetical protein [Oscillospiraceae bacterium]